MKVRFSLLLFILLSAEAFSQTKNNVSLQYGLNSAIVDIHGAVGDYGYDTKSGMNIGITYTRELTRHFAIETGMLFVNDNVQLKYIVGGLGEKTATGTVKLISVPVIAKLTFLNYLFADGGISLDEQTNYTNNNVVNKQSGLGFELGVGGKYSFNRFTIFVNPYLHGYAITRVNNNLIESGVKFGVGIDF